MQKEYILALTALLSTTTFRIRFHYSTTFVLLFSPRVKKYIKNIEKKEYKKSTSGHLPGTALLSTTTFGIRFHDKYTTTFALLFSPRGCDIIVYSLHRDPHFLADFLTLIS